jgi:antitoxin CptB
MTGSIRSSEGLSPRRRRLLFHSWHRGIREMDLLMGRFADSCIAELEDEYEKLLEVPDHDLYVWITGEAIAPAPYATALLRRLRAFHENSRGSR